MLDGFDSIGGDHGPSDALFVAQYVIPFLGLDKTTRSIPRSRNVVTEAPAAALARPAAPEGEEREEPREAPGGGAAAPVRGLRRRAEPPAAAAVAQAGRRARAESAARLARRGGEGLRAAAAPSRLAATREAPGERRALAAPARRPAEPSAPAREARRQAAAPVATRREDRILEPVGAAVLSPLPARARLDRRRVRSGTGAGGPVARSSAPSVVEVSAGDVRSCRAGFPRTGSWRPSRRTR